MQLSGEIINWGFWPRKVMLLPLQRSIRNNTHNGDFHTHRFLRIKTVVDLSWSETLIKFIESHKS